MFVLYALLVALSVIVCLFADRIGTRLKVVDEPDGDRKLHSRRTPLVGGIAIVLPLVLVCIVLAFDRGRLPLFGTLTVALVAYFAIGFADDYRNRAPLERLAACLLVAFVVISVVPMFRLELLSFSFSGPVLRLGAGGFLLTLVCIVGLANAINMADGQNGLVIGLSLIWTVLLFAYAPAELYPVLAVLAAGLVVTLPFNLRGLVFLGDSGTYGISIALATITIYSYNLGRGVFHADVAMLLFLVPVVDCLRLMLVRFLRFGSPFRGGRDHFHHILSRLMPAHLALAAYWALVGVPSLLALAFPNAAPSWALLALASYALILRMSAQHQARDAVGAATQGSALGDRFSIGGSDD